MLQPVVTEVERLLHRSEIAAAGAFRCRADHSLFRNSGPASGYLMVFPRTSTKLQFAGGGSITATPALAVFYNIGQEYRRRKVDASDSCDWFMFAEDVVRDAVACYDGAVADRGGSIFPMYTGPVSSRLYLRQRRIHEALASNDSLHSDESIVGLLHDALRESFGAPRRRTVIATGAVETVKAILASRPAANPSLRALAVAAGCSPYDLCRFFRAETSYTITQYKHALRLRMALGALKRARDLTDLALELGYASHSHFTMHFRRHFGVTPSAMRQAW